MTQPIHFLKMHGLGNDFMVIDGINQSIDIDKLSILSLSHRHIGVGFDQLLLVGPSDRADFSCRFFNADGSEAEQCGNGVRCVARFIHEQKLSPKNALSLETRAGVVDLRIHDYNTIQASMGMPLVEALQFELNIASEEMPLQLTTVSMGNPHAVLQISAIEEVPVYDIGSEVSMHPAFPQGVNVGFMEIVNTKHIRLRTFERGVGETFACGSNACAAVVAGISHHLLASSVTVELAFGHLQVEWQGGESPVLMTGPASSVFSGVIQLA